MSCHVCPWWMGCLIDNPLRRLIHNPRMIVEPYVKPGATAMDVGCGLGLFSIAIFGHWIGPRFMHVTALEDLPTNILARN